MSPEDKILKALERYPERSAASLMELTGLSAGRIFPELYRLESIGVLGSKWIGTRMPRRRVYWKATV